MSEKTKQPTASDLACLPKTPGLTPNEGVTRTFVIDLLAPGTRRQIHSTVREYHTEQKPDAFFHGGNADMRNTAQHVIEELNIEIFFRLHDAFVPPEEENSTQRFQRVHNGVLEVALDIKESLPSVKRRHILVCCAALDCEAMTIYGGPIDPIKPGNVIRVIVAYEDNGSNSSWRIAHIVQLLCPLADDPF